MVGTSNPQYDTYDIPIHEIWVADEFNCREGISRESVDSMVKSIDREGLAYPVDVQSGEDVEGIPAGFKFRLVCGFRRLTACKMLGWTTIPARLRGGLTERSAAFMNLSENLERKNLNILEEALALEKLFPAYRTQRSIAAELNQSTEWVSLRLFVLILPAWIQKMAASGRFTEGNLRSIRHSSDSEAAAKNLLRATKDGKKFTLHHKSRPKKKAEVKEVMVAMLDEGFSPELIRPLGWAIGEVSDEGLDESLNWLRDRKGWLK